MKLVIDIGNTRAKWAVFKADEMIAVESATKFDVHVIGRILADFPDIDQAILSSVRDFPSDCRDLLSQQTDFFVELTHQTPVPLVNRYKSPETLGLDRLAAAVGASVLFPGHALLIIDAGTAITIDLVNPSNEYLGGNISPGIETRYRALNQFTGKLPLLQLTDNFELLGSNTPSAIIAGVQQGVIFELRSYIKHFKLQYPDLTCLLTGGHAAFLAKNIDAEVKVVEQLTLQGLLEILRFNKR